MEEKFNLSELVGLFSIDNIFFDKLEINVPIEKFLIKTLFKNKDMFFIEGNNADKYIKESLELIKQGNLNTALISLSLAYSYNPFNVQIYKILAEKAIDLNDTNALQISLINFYKICYKREDLSSLMFYYGQLFDMSKKEQLACACYALSLELEDNKFLINRTKKKISAIFKISEKEEFIIALPGIMNLLNINEIPCGLNNIIFDGICSYFILSMIKKDKSEIEETKRLILNVTLNAQYFIELLQEGFKTNTNINISPANNLSLLTEKKWSSQKMNKKNVLFCFNSKECKVNIEISDYKIKENSIKSCISLALTKISKIGKIIDRNYLYLMNNKDVEIIKYFIKDESGERYICEAIFPHNGKCLTAKAEYKDYISLTEKDIIKLISSIKLIN